MAEQTAHRVDREARGCSDDEGGRLLAPRRGPMGSGPGVEEAARKLQAHVRGYLARKHYAKTFHEAEV